VYLVDVEKWVCPIVESIGACGLTGIKRRTVFGRSGRAKI